MGDLFTDMYREPECYWVTLWRWAALEAILEMLLDQIPRALALDVVSYAVPTFIPHRCYGNEEDCPWLDQLSWLLKHLGAAGFVNLLEKHARHCAAKYFSWKSWRKESTFFEHLRRYRREMLAEDLPETESPDEETTPQ